MDWVAALETNSLIASIMLFAAGFLLVQACFGIFTETQVRTVLNRRLKLKTKSESASQLIVELRRQRALNEDGDFALPSKWFNKLVTRSGLAFHPVRWTVFALTAGALVGGAVWYFAGMPIVAAAMGGGTTLLGPFMVLKFAAGARTKKMSRQLVDALQIVARSLEAGHPVPTAVALVAREMPDPIGSEFGMAADEMSYGLSLTEAVRRLGVRASDPDVDLFAATVRLQEKTGGNLTELLKANVNTIRERQTLALKVKAASSEGRASAMILTSAPFIVVLIVHLMRPEFYGSVIHVPAMQYTFAGFGIWMLIGNLIMNKMINFRT